MLLRLNIFIPATFIVTDIKNTENKNFTVETLNIRTHFKAYK